MKTFPIIFNYDDVKNLYPNRATYYSFLNRSLKNGKIKQIKKGLYALVDPSTGFIFATKFQIACKLFYDAYFSYHDALEFYGLANQCFVSRFTYLTHTYVDVVSFEEINYVSKKENCELEIKDYMKEAGIRIVSLERAIVDSINNPGEAGGLEEVENALGICPKLDIKIVVKLLNYHNKAFLYQKVGYLFEKYFGNEVPDSFYELCLSKSGNTIRYFYVRTGSAKYIRKWKLMVPKERDLPTELY